MKLSPRFRPDHGFRQAKPVVLLTGKKMGIAAFKASPVTLAQIAVSFRQSGDAEQARGVISAGLGFFPGDAMLYVL